MTYSTAAIAHLRAREGYAPRWLLWTRIKNAVTLVEEPMGLWSGDKDATFEIKGEQRPYYGTQGLFQADDIVNAVGMEVRTQKVKLSGLTPSAVATAQSAIVRNARAELHEALFDPVTMNLIHIERVWDGIIEKAPRQTPALGEGGSTITFEIANKMRMLSRRMPLTKSNEMQKRRNPVDAFRKDGSIAAAAAPVIWGAKK